MLVKYDSVGLPIIPPVLFEKLILEFDQVQEFHISSAKQFINSVYNCIVEFDDMVTIQGCMFAALPIIIAPAGFILLSIHFQIDICPFVLIKAGVEPIFGIVLDCQHISTKVFPIDCYHSFSLQYFLIFCPNSTVELGLE